MLRNFDIALKIGELPIRTSFIFRNLRELLILRSDRIGVRKKFGMLSIVTGGSLGRIIGGGGFLVTESLV